MREALHVPIEPQDHPRITLIKELRTALQEYTEHPPIGPPNLVKDICAELSIVIQLQENIAMSGDATVKDTLKEECERCMQTLDRLTGRLSAWQSDPFNG